MGDARDDGVRDVGCTRQQLDTCRLDTALRVGRPLQQRYGLAVDAGEPNTEGDHRASALRTGLGNRVVDLRGNVAHVRVRDDVDESLEELLLAPGHAPHGGVGVEGVEGGGEIGDAVVRDVLLHH